MPTPLSSSSRAVPPVETISTSSSFSPRAKSTSPRLSDTVSSARRTRTSPGCVTSSAPPSVVANVPLLDDHSSRRLGVEAHGTGSYQPHRPRKQTVLYLMNSSFYGGDVAMVRNRVEGLLQDDRAG